MNFFKDNIPELPSINEISVELPAISEYCHASRLPELFRETESDTLPVIDLKGKLVGIISEYDLAKLLPDWSFEENSYTHEYMVSSLMSKEVWSETKDTNISGLLSKVNKMHTRVIPIIEEDGTYTGTAVTRTEIINYLTKFIKPRALGGLATPLGVYITDGKHQAGSGNFGLFLTGFSLGLIIYSIQFMIFLITGSLGIDINDEHYIPFILIGQIIFFLLILRLTPLVKIHAAEHQTINAIEKGIPLSFETVKMQPKEHIRCGTNLMALIIGVQVVIIVYAVYLKAIEPIFQFLFLVVGFSFVFSNWKKWGMFIQKYFTTVKASEKYILSGIKAGEEILRKNKKDVDPTSPSFFQKIWSMGIIQIISGFLLVNYLFDIAQRL